ATFSRRAFSELTFQVAIRTGPRLPRAGPPWLVLRALSPAARRAPSPAALRAHRREALVDRDLELLRRLLPVVEPGQHPPRQALPDRALDARHVPLLLRRDEEEGVAL